MVSSAWSVFDVFDASTNIKILICQTDTQVVQKSTGPSCSKLTMSLVNDSLKFTSSDTQIR